MSLINDGMITANPQPFAPEQRTIIVTGVARSGTSMIAQLVSIAGVSMGHTFDEVVFEDHAVADAFSSSDPDVLAHLVAARNEQAKVWGFKRPHVFHLNAPDFQALFREPRFIITYRDAVAVAKRNGISEYTDVVTSLRTAAADIQRCVEFTLALTCPALLISYEKALLRPAALVEELVEFCGLATSQAERDRMAAAVKANRDEYVQAARRLFQGYVDRIKDGALLGWCWQIGVPSPVTLDISIGDRPPVSVMADDFRADLAGADVGFGCHAFHLDLSGLEVGPEAVVTVRVHERVFELSGSGKTIAELSS
ncbi:hypothetical protein [Lichenicoccus sp.]|uniref:hypothetical protein n=1 Tax=Lichenicoccus sp. TaxID=2781899 RepID=UPI003D13F25C